MFFRRKVGMSKSWPSTMVGSLFSKRPRVAGSNCITSCFAWTHFSFGAFASFSTTAFFFGGIKRGAGFLIEGAGAGGGASAVAGCSDGIRSLGVGCVGTGIGGSVTGAWVGVGP